MQRSTLCFLDQGEIFGGAECFLLDLLEDISKERWKLVLITSSHAHERYKKKLQAMPWVTVYTLPLFKSLPVTIPVFLRTFFVFIGIWWICWSEKVSLIVSNTARTHLLSGLVARWLGVHSVWIMHDMTFPKRLGWVAGLCAQQIVCVSSTVATYVKNLSSTLYKKPITIIPNGVDDAGGIHDKIQIQTSDGAIYKKQPGEYWIGMVGRVDVWKGQDIFVRAIYEIIEHRRDMKIKAFIVGENMKETEEQRQYVKNLETYIRINGLEKYIIRTGFCPKEDIYPSLDIVVHASTEPEPFGRTIIEAWSYGLPVIASNQGGPREIITHNENGLLFDNNNYSNLSTKVQDILSSSALQERLGASGYTIFQELYSKNSVVAKVEKLFSTLI